MSDFNADTPCARRHYEITAEDLPLCCPLPASRLWDGHPRIYLPVEETGHEICPYCGAEYTLKGFVVHNQDKEE